MTRAPDWARLPAATPPAVRHLLRRCLDRNPQTRLQSIGEARITLSDPGITAVPEPAVPAHGRPSWVLCEVLAVAAAVGGATLGWILKPTQPAGRAVLKLDLGVDDFEMGADRTPALSPDGQRIVYRASERLFVRALNSPQARELEGTAGAFYFFWSPDSRQIAFVSDGGVCGARRSTRESPCRSAACRGISPDRRKASGRQTANSFWSAAIPPACSPFRRAAGRGRRFLALDKAQETDFHEIAQLPDGRGLNLHGPPARPRPRYDSRLRRRQPPHRAADSWRRTPVPGLFELRAT